MDFLVRQWWIRRTRKSIVRLKQQAVNDFRYAEPPVAELVKSFVPPLPSIRAPSSNPTQRKPQRIVDYVSRGPSGTGSCIGPGRSRVAAQETDESLDDFRYAEPPVAELVKSFVPPLPSFRATSSNPTQRKPQRIVDYLSRGPSGTGLCVGPGR
ncbi:hypothetical protein Rcae01_06564 [Novipirellula caenicola]|uniref:Uncharacterized protein n=1 Tax=Novipirellula caenicola TaxID=1536901 RepID=A0ABP9W0Z6_9BACT